MEIKQLCIDACENADKHGFYEDIDAIEKIDDCRSYEILMNNAISTRLALIIGEVSESMEELRKGNMDKFEEELADVAIRLFDLCGFMDIDLEVEIEKKMDKNKSRAYKHGKLF